MHVGGIVSYERFRPNRGGSSGPARQRPASRSRQRDKGTNHAPRTPHKPNTLLRSVFIGGAPCSWSASPASISASTAQASPGRPSPTATSNRSCYARDIDRESVPRPIERVLPATSRRGADRNQSTSDDHDSPSRTLRMDRGGHHPGRLERRTSRRRRPRFDG